MSVLCITNHVYVTVESKHLHFKPAQTVGNMLRLLWVSLARSSGGDCSQQWKCTSFQPQQPMVTSFKQRGGFSALGFNGEVMAKSALGRKKKERSEVELNWDFKKWKIKVWGFRPVKMFNSSCSSCRWFESSCARINLVTQ